MTKPTPMRWGVLAAFAAITATVQLQWVAFAPVSRVAARFYGFADTVPIDRLAELYMAVYVLAAVPASWLLQRRGVRFGVGVGAVLAGAAALVKGYGAGSYAVVFGAQVALALAQPLILNAATALVSRWFPPGERVTAVGLATLAQFIGIIAAMILTPELIREGDALSPGALPGVMVAYGWVTAASALLFLAVVRRERAAGAVAVEDVPSFGTGLRRLWALRDFRWVLVLFFLELGIFNAVSACLDAVCASKGLDEDRTGLVGAALLVAGVAGAIVLPVLSDRLRKRRGLLVLAMAGAVPGLLGLALGDGFAVVAASAALVGFFVVGAGPVGFQYAAEIGAPAPEATSQGLLLLAGQVSGLVFAELLGIRAAIGPLLLAFAVMTVGVVFVASRLRESPAVSRSGA